jgi:hypothetical protein
MLSGLLQAEELHPQPIMPGSSSWPCRFLATDLKVKNRLRLIKGKGTREPKPPRIGLQRSGLMQLTQQSNGEPACGNPAGLREVSSRYPVHGHPTRLSHLLNPSTPKFRPRNRQIHQGGKNAGQGVRSVNSKGAELRFHAMKIHNSTNSIRHCL